MFLRGSRYEKALPFLGEDGPLSSFRGIRPRAIGPATGVIEHTVREGDRLDLLARHYYDDGRLWWRIADANPEFFYGADLVLKQDQPSADVDPSSVPLSSMVGRIILIPKARQ